VIDPKHTGTVDHARLRRAVLEIPAEFDGYAVLDWEVPVFRWIKKGPGTPEFDRAVANMLEALRLARSLRPNAKWGYYGLPRKEYWARNEAWREESRALQPLVAEVDALFPSVYDHYRDGIDRKTEKEHAYIRDNVAMALEVADGKPVFAYVTHRYHGSNEKAGKDRIPLDELKGNVRAVFEAEHQGRKATGVIYWGVEEWKVVKLGHYKDEFRPGESPGAFVDRVHRETLTAIAEALPEQR
jgi:hypothetical protein